MNKKLKILIYVLAVAVVGWFLFKDRLIMRLSSVKESADVVLEDIKKDILTPPPLRATHESAQAYLTRGGVIKWTNIQRINAGLAQLSENPQLDKAARLKVEDMFNRQYFEHISPTGGNIGTLLDGVGYRYLSIGENLALGNFKNDQTLIQAWMDSPGHRANILNQHFQEIGVAVGKGIFGEHQTWLAVQAFALPLAACPSIDETLKDQITSVESQIAELKVSADSILTELENLPRRGQEYKQKVDEYNTIVNQINNLVGQEKILVAKYNDQVRIFNSCISGS